MMLPERTKKDKSKQATHGPLEERASITAFKTPYA